MPLPLCQQFVEDAEPPAAPRAGGAGDPDQREGGKHLPDDLGGGAPGLLAASQPAQVRCQVSGSWPGLAGGLMKARVRDVRVRCYT